MQLDEESFHSPPAEYRGHPFWVWNDTMEEHHLTEQVKAMAGAGWGGFFPHARFGNAVDPLSTEWFEKVAHSVEVGLDAGLTPWLYDEDHWPSGYAGGAIPALGPEYRVKCLSLKDAPTANDDVLDIVAAGGEQYYVCVTTADRGSESTAKGTPYADLMNPDVVEEFLARTYERYEEAVGEHFGEGVEGVFTDEPQLYVKPEAEDLHGFVPWTAGLPTAFHGAHGYDLTDHLASLFFDRDTAGRSYEAVRYDFWRFVTERFAETFSQRLGEWCDERGLDLTGHYQHEHSIPEQIRTSGAVMPHYRHQGQPGIDHLGRAVVNRQNNPLKVKQCTSVARQFDRSALCELYGTSGQQLSFEARKWLVDWNLVHGITFVNHHLSLYSMRGERKRDYPPNLFYQQPWWEYNERIADYVGRMAWALRQGDAFADTLVLHPVQSGWLAYSNFDESDLSRHAEHATLAREPARELNRRFNDLVEDLLAAHVHFDLGDELVIEDEGAVEGDQFVVGTAAYDTVVVPYCRTLQSSTVERLEAFADAGGTVVVVGESPSLVDGRPAEGRLDGVLAAAEQTDLDGVVERAHRPVRLLDDDGEETATDVMVQARRVDGGLVVFLANPDREAGRSFNLRFDREGALERWDAATGERRPVAAERADGATLTRVELPRSGSLLLALDPDGDPGDGGADLARTGPPADGDRVALDGAWRVSRHDPNALVVDVCDLELDGEHLGDVNVAAHWQDKTELYDPDGHVPFSATYAFEVDEAVADGSFDLVVESADEVTVRVNGTDLPPTDERWRDIHWHRFDVSERVEAGRNTVTVEGNRSATVSVEPIYVLGEFAVEEDRRLVSEPETIPEPELAAHGYPFFAGEATLETTVAVEKGGSATLAVDDLGLGVALAATGVGDADGELLWPPWTVPIDLSPGENTVQFRLVTSLRNLTGPLHTDEPAPTFVTPESFRPGEENPYLERDAWTDEYTTVPVGVQNPRLVVED